MKLRWLLLALTACTDQNLVAEIESEVGSSTSIANNVPISNTLGFSTTFSTAGEVDLTGDFFADLGTNQRHCGSCHKASEGWTISAARTQALFDETSGLDPLFRRVDGSNRPDADVSTVEARRAAYSMLLSRATIRVGIGIPTNAEFELAAVDDPYGYASARELSLFRRPLPSANLTLIPTVMWDGRVAEGTLTQSLAAQSNGATQGHAEAPAPIPQETRDAIVAFETGLFNGQIITHAVGRLDSDGARGGGEALATQAFVAARFDLFDAWANSDTEARRAVFRGQELFNEKRRPSGAGACRGCHSAANVGTNRNGTMFNIGLGDASRRKPDQPLYTLRNLATGEEIATTDPGRALITGLWRDVGRFKVPSIRALGARAPYFHDGSANSLSDVVKFYESSLGFDFTEQEEADLVAFLAAL